MPEFIRSRVNRKKEDEVTKKTVFLGVFTMFLVVMLIVFGLPMLVRLSILLGELKGDGETVVEKVLPPMTPRLVLAFEATNSGVISIAGFAEKGVNVDLLKNDISIGKREVGENGEFVFEDVFLDDGINLFNAVAVSDVMGSSEPSKPVLVTYDVTPPELEMINPVEEKLSVDFADFDITGVAEPDSKVTINGRIALVNDDGKFKFRYQLASGKNNLEVVVRDVAGNETRKQLEITFDI